MQNNNNMNLLGFEDVVLDSLDEDNDFVHIHASVKRMDIVFTVGLVGFGFMIIEFKGLRILISVVRNVLFI
ncbi:hypothetical protein [Peptoniphilus vaginalis]|uniref:hypothetical protein n=1 Tax=Peptoniphilus vaginalis TaxID=1756987 RepID=UPI0023F955DF|nr:hypothetical protein [Peptoniphilus vaginalis]